MPYREVHCKQCGAAIGGETFPQRMAKLRRHYADKHPRIWKKSIKRGVRKRAERRKA